MSRASFADLLKAQNEKKQKSIPDKTVSAAEKSYSQKPPTTHHHPPPPTTTHQAEAKQNQPVSPIRDFAKVPNSVIRNAIPEGLFKGVSKNTYDALYLRTRGAVNPTRIIRAKQSDLLMWANVSHNTLKGHLKHLQSVGLIKIHYQRGDNDGADYEIFLPEELNSPPPSTTTHHPPPTTHQKLGGPTTQKLVLGGGWLPPENIEQNESPKTLYKDNIKSDDDAFADFVEEFEKFSKRITGKKARSAEKEKWRELAEVIITELEIAAARANVSSLPAFAAEHLRRRLLGEPKTEKKSRNSLSNVGKTPPHVRESFDERGNLIVTPLTEEGKSENLKILREMTAEGFSIAGMEKFFTVEDWTWLNGELKKN